MFTTRRIFMTGLAAVLSVIRIPGVSARAAIEMPEDEFNDYENDAPIEYLEVGEREDMLGGPATEAGWYLHPTCMVGCCETKGPFSSRENALEADRIFWDEMAKRRRSKSKVDGGTEEIEPF
jgi:hypothetical protein